MTAADPSGPILGVRVKSGWASAVLVGCPAGEPVVLDSRRLELADPATPATTQPYHAARGTAQLDQAVIATLIEQIERSAAHSIGEALAAYRAAGLTPRGAAVIGTSDRDPETITNPHIRVHALEGRLFRRVVTEALTGAGIPTTYLLEQDLGAGAVPSNPGQGPWRSEQKSAARGACLLLSSGSAATGSRAPRR